MIEVPSAAIMTDVLAKEVDFFSVGTNDLTQYTIAVDRVNNRVANMFRPTHPAVVRIIGMTIAAGDKEGIPTAICGEMAGDITLLPLLVGLGATSMSVGVHLVPIIATPSAIWTTASAGRWPGKPSALPTAGPLSI